jgi:hypothetical protein
MKIENQVAQAIQHLSYKSSRSAYSDLVDPSLGVTVLTLKTKRDDLSALKTMLEEEGNETTNKARVVGNIYQDFALKTKYQQESSIFALQKKILQEIEREIYDKYKLIRPAGIYEIPLLQRYDYRASSRKYAIPPHRDYKANVGLIAILLVCGPSLFSVTTKRRGGRVCAIQAREMDIILMRGYRFCDEKNRPIHFVEKIPKGIKRISLTFRMIGDKREDIQRMEKALRIP